MVETALVVPGIALDKLDKRQLRAWVKTQDNDRLLAILKEVTGSAVSVVSSAKDVFVAGMSHEEIRYFVILICIVLLTRFKLVSPEMGGLLVGSYIGMATIDTILPW